MNKGSRIVWQDIPGTDISYLSYKNSCYLIFFSSKLIEEGISYQNLLFSSPFQRPIV